MPLPLAEQFRRADARCSHVGRTPRFDRDRPLELLIFDMAQQRPERLAHVDIHRVSIEFCQQPNRKRRRWFDRTHAVYRRYVAIAVWPDV